MRRNFPVRLSSSGIQLFAGDYCFRASTVRVGSLTFSLIRDHWLVDRAPTDDEREAFLTGVELDNGRWETEPYSKADELVIVA